jgi:hypothetical protein
VKDRRTGILGSLLASALVCAASSAQAQAPVALDDGHAVAAEGTLVVDPPGVLENDTDALGENLPPTAVAQLLDDVGNGTLILASDGSFSYTPTPGFLGIDTFTYRVVDGGLTSNPATVTLDVSGCAGSLPRLTCWVESEFVAELTALGYATYGESFEEGSIWPLAPDGATSVTDLGIAWTANLAGNELETGSGAAYSGARGVFSIPHGVTSGPLLTPQRDGFIGTSVGTLIGVGGWLRSNTPPAKVQFVLTSPPNPPEVVDFGDPTLSGAHRFFGVIDTRGFSTFEVVETEGVVGDQKLIFADDFTFAVTGAPLCGDGMDNDGDGLSDFPLDPGCLAAASPIEDPQCQDGSDNDGDERIDFDGGESIHGPCSNGFCPPGVSDPDLDGIADPDPQCVDRPWQARERPKACGLGFEIGAVLGPMLAWRRRRLRRRDA